MSITQRNTKLEESLTALIQYLLTIFLIFFQKFSQQLPPGSKSRTFCSKVSGLISPYQTGIRRCVVRLPFSAIKNKLQ